MRTLAISLLLLWMLPSWAVDFNRLSQNEPVTTTYEANAKCYVDVNLFLNAKEAKTKSIFLRVSYIIGEDTLNDSRWIDGNFDGLLKRIFLDQGERVTAMLWLNNAEVEQVENLWGTFSIIRNLGFSPPVDQGQNDFVGNIWKSDQTPLFRISVADSVSKVFRLKFGLNENYEFDKLFFKIKVISPTEGIVMVDRELVVNEKDYLKVSRKTFEVDIDEVDVSAPGSYYFQLMHNMANVRVNGVETVDYELVTE